MNVLLIYGGASPEHEVSVRSAETIRGALVSAGHTVYLAYVTKDGSWTSVQATGQSDGEDLAYDESVHLWKTASKVLAVDVAFPIVHGVTGEDGVLQQYLEKTHTPYVGCSAAVSELCFDKFKTKQALNQANIPISPELIVHSSDAVPTYAEIMTKLGKVLFVKPARSGSSIGVHKVTNEAELTAALQDAFIYDNMVLIEAAVPAPREFEVSVLEDEQHELLVSGVGEIIPGETFYSYDDKYADGSAAQVNLHPALTPELERLIRDTAKKTAGTLGCQGMVRVDFLYATELDKLYVNEVNTLPGFTSISMYPKLWEIKGLNLPELCNQLVRVAALKNN